MTNLRFITYISLTLRKFLYILKKIKKPTILARFIAYCFVGIRDESPARNIIV